MGENLDEVPRMPTSAPTTATLDDQLSGLETEGLDATRRDLDLLSTDALVSAMIEEQAKVIDALRFAKEAFRAAVDRISERMESGGRLIYCGAGTSGRLGVLDASECPPTFGTDPSLVVGLIAGGDIALRAAIERAEDDADAGRSDLEKLQVTSNDTVVGITASGRTPYVLGALDAGQQAGALTVSISNNRGSLVAQHADVAIDLDTGPEFIAGSTRLNAGSAQKVALNLLSTLAMVRLGKTYGNVMVDLRVTNEKLAARAERTVRQVTGSGAADSARALADADGSVKQAIVQIARGVDPEHAKRLLSEHGGRLRAALEEPGR